MKERGTKIVFKFYFYYYVYILFFNFIEYITITLIQILI